MPTVTAPIFRPSEPRSHCITEQSPLAAWKAVVHRVMRFGIPSIASRVKKRIELQNLKVVITDPREESDDDLRKYGFSLEEMHGYQKNIMNPDKPQGLPYTYGNRLRSYWCARYTHPEDRDSLYQVIRRLKEDKTTRSTYISLWDQDRDGKNGRASPCLISLFFRTFQDRLTLTATFRSHNVMSAWLKNLYGLMAIQCFVAEHAGLMPGAIIVFSHSITIDPTSVDRFDLAQRIADAREDDQEQSSWTRKKSFRKDPNGYFAFELDETAQEIVAELRSNGEVVTIYRGKTAAEIERQIVRDEAVSVLSHALYVGRQLAICETKLGWIIGRLT